MPRYKLTLEYDGAPYKGFQRQQGVKSVQEALETAILAFSREIVTAFVAGRTDTGVHARGQVCHIDLSQDYPPERVRAALNFYLHDEAVRVLQVRAVSENFHARFSATARRYCYRILNRSVAPAIDRQRVWHISRFLDVEAMQKACQYLTGHHDFSTFRTVHCQAKSPFRTMDQLYIVRREDEIHCWAQAKSFLHHQVRNIVGSLYWVGCNRWSPEDIRTALELKDRTAGGPTAPAEGLYLTNVLYEEDCTRDDFSLAVQTKAP